MGFAVIFATKPHSLFFGVRKLNPCRSACATRTFGRSHADVVIHCRVGDSNRVVCVGLVAGWDVAARALTKLM